MSSVVLQTVDIPCTTLTLGNPGCQWCYRRTTLSFSPSLPTPVHEQQHLTSQLARKYSRLCRRHSHTSKIVTLLFYFLQAGHPNEGTTVIKHAIHKQKVYTKQSEKWSFSWCKVSNLPNVTASRARTKCCNLWRFTFTHNLPRPGMQLGLRMRLSHCLKINTF